VRRVIGRRDALDHELARRLLGDLELHRLALRQANDAGPSP
jgi:hypothetical protein